MRCLRSTISDFQITTVLSTIVTMLYVTSLKLIYFITGSLCLLIPTLILPTPHRPSLATTKLFPVSFLLWFFWFHKQMGSYGVCLFSIWLILLSTIASRSVHVVTDDKISSFYGWVIFHFLYIPHFNSFTSGWVRRLFPHLCYCKCDEHRDAYFFLK